MALNPEMRNFLSTKMFALVGCIMIVYFAFHLLQGDKGILTYISLQGSLHQMQQQDAEQSAKVKAMEEKVARLRPATFDKDFAEEQARSTAGVMRADEKIIVLDAPE